MNVLYLSMFAVAVVAGAVFARPYLQREADAGVRRRRANVLAYQGRLGEIESERTAGLIDAESALALHGEADAQLLEAGEGADTFLPSAPGRRLWVWPLLALVVGGIAALGYWQAGSWRTVATIELAKRDPAAAQERMVADMVERLESRLQREPDDAEGWAMLGRSYQVLDRSVDALTAYTRANALSEKRAQPDWLVAEGELRAMASESHSLQPARALFARALEADAQHPRALLYAGLAAAQAGEYGAALDLWLRLRALELSPDIAEVLEQRLPQLAAMAGRELPPRMAAVVGPSLQLDVSLAAELAARRVPGMVLFVFARAEQGPPMPLAVRRLESFSLPLQVVLDDSLAMMPELRLSQFERWTVTARLTRSGDVQAQSGDLEGRLSVSREQAAGPLRLVMDRVVP